MKLTPNSFFDGLFQEINLDNFLNLWCINGLDPLRVQEALSLIHDTGFITYGGYGENRKRMFEGSYLDRKRNYIHLGIDINVPSGTPVKCPFDAQVVDIFVDKDTHIGWGGRLVLGKMTRPLSEKPFGRYKYPSLVLAHLNPRKLSTKTFIEKGEILGEVGTRPTNGNVFDHLHIQCIKHCNFQGFDGYGFKEDLKDNPNPFEIDW